MNVSLLNVKKNVTESLVIVSFGIIQKCFLVYNSHVPVNKELKRFSLDLTEEGNKLINM